MNIKQVTKEAMEEAKRELEEEREGFSPQEPEAPEEEVDEETLQSLLDRLAAETPEEVVDLPQFGNAKIPGFEELTVGVCKVYEIKYGTLKYLREKKDEGEIYEPHVLNTPRGLHIIRGFSRREWASIQKHIIQQQKKRMELHGERGSDEEWASADIEMCTEEILAIRGCVQPSYNQDTIRQLPTGLVTYLSESVLRCSGHSNRQLPPLPLK